MDEFAHSHINSFIDLYGYIEKICVCLRAYVNQLFSSQKEIIPATINLRSEQLNLPVCSIK